MADLLIPYAVDHQKRLQDPATAEKGLPYFCPECAEPVILRRGEIKVPHFAHKSSDTCSIETITHRIAKLLIEVTVAEWKEGRGPAPTLRRKCRACWEPIDQSLPDKVDRAVLEYPLSDGSIADVVLMGGDEPLAAIEIHVTHRVDESKATRLPIPFIELEGSDVVENPTVWRPIVDQFNAVACPKCRETLARFLAKAERVAAASGVELPAPTYYRHAFCRCWSCGHDITVFAWPSDGLHGEEPRVTPYPPTIQYRQSKTTNRAQWANTCPFCSALQSGDYLRRDVFQGADLCDDSEAEYEKDMLTIALQAREQGLL